ncbi:MAG TPA: TPM domain-containing protein, partial [Pyrinomonadaceae bacterium]|nr:TPM domain-containing protein [Pyrinomonadaceae bacterium]
DALRARRGQRLVAIITQPMRTRLSVNLRALLLALFVCLAAATAARAQVAPTCPLPRSEAYVHDQAGIMDDATEQRLEAILANLKERADIEYAVVTVRTTGGQPTFEYTLAIARGCGIGSKEGERKGMITLVAVDDRKYFTQVSRHLEGDLPDGLIGEIQRRTMVERFRAGDYGGGLTNAVETFVATLAEKRNFSVEGIDRSRAYRPQPERTTRRTTRNADGGLSIGACCIIAIVALIIISLMSRGGRRGGGGWGGGGGGCLNALLLANLFSNMGGGGRSSGWGGGGGSSSGWGGGGGGGFGGFGGGGDFGGGGAGGEW